jgi:transmembrane sensor
MNHSYYNIPPEIEEWISGQPESEQNAYRKLWHDTGTLGRPDIFASAEDEARETSYAFTALSSILFDREDGDLESGKSGYSNLNDIISGNHISNHVSGGSGSKSGQANNPITSKNSFDFDEDKNIDNPRKSVSGIQKNESSAVHDLRVIRSGRLFRNESRPRSYMFWAAAAVLIMALSVGYIMHLNSEISVYAPYGEQISYVFSDGTSVDLNSGSSLHFSRNFDSGSRRVSLQGEAFFDVESDERPFIVETHNAMLRVTGTSFNVRARTGASENETSVVLTEGGLEFIPRITPDNSVILKPGQLSRLKELSERPTEPEETTTESFLAWRSGGLFFSDEPLTHIFSEIERRFNARIDVSPELVTDQRFSVLYTRPESAEIILRDICTENQLNMAVLEENRFRIY